MKINSGEISSAKAKKPRKLEGAADNAAPATALAAQPSRGGRGGRGGGRGHGGFQATNPDPSVPNTDAQQTQQTSGMPAGNVVTVCSRCGKPGHVFAMCYASFHLNGTGLESPKPAPVPDQVALDRKARWMKQQAEAPEKSIHTAEFTSEYAQELAWYRESVDRGVDPKSKLISGPITSEHEIFTLEGSTDASPL